MNIRFAAGRHASVGGEFTLKDHACNSVPDSDPHKGEFCDFAVNFSECVEGLKPRN